MERKSAVDAGPSSNKDRRRPGPWPPGIEPFVSKTGHNPGELKSWANRTGFVHNVSGESTLSSIIDEGSDDAVPMAPPQPPPIPNGRGVGLDLEKGIGRRLGNDVASKVKLEPILGQRRVGADISQAADLDSELVGLKDVGRRFEKEKRRIGVEPEVGLKVEGRGVGNDRSVRGKGEGINGAERGNGQPAMEMKSGDGEPKKDEVEIDLVVDRPEQEITAPFKSGLVCDLMENPGFGRLFLYGIQHYLSLAGSLIFVPLIMVPTMGGTDGETANVISTILLVSGVTTIMHSFFGTRLPLVQGSSFVYLAPALIIINSEEYRNLSDNT